MRTPLIMFISLLVSVGLASLTGYNLDPETFAGFAFTLMMISLWLGIYLGLNTLADKVLGKQHPWES